MKEKNYGLYLIISWETILDGLVPKFRLREKIQKDSNTGYVDVLTKFLCSAKKINFLRNFRLNLNQSKGKMIKDFLL